MGRKAALHNLGCKVNAYETESMEQMLIEDGYEIVGFDEKADVYLINTCSVTNVADHKSRQMIHRARKQNPDAVIVAAGCYVQTSRDKAIEDTSIDIIIGNNCKKDLIQQLHLFLSEHSKVTDVMDLTHETDYESLQMVTCKEHTRAFVKVQDGCNQFCTYCIIPFARGRVRSRNIDQVEQEIRTLSQNGYQEVVLTGIHLSSYGIDCNQTLLELIRKVHNIEGIKRIRLGSLEPGIITDDFVEELSRMPKVCPHFHLSLQSGCNDTLKRMNRKYTAEEFEQRCHIIRSYYEHPALTTDVIVGFPGETKEEFQITREFLERIHFYEIHLFKYSRRQGTTAAVMNGQIEEQEKTRRSRILEEDQAPRKKAFIDYYLGKQVEVLFEEEETKNGKSFFTGYTPEYVKFSMKSDTDIRNQIKKIEFSREIY